MLNPNQISNQSDVKSKTSPKPFLWLIAIFAVMMISLWIELQGWRITDPELTLSEVWGKRFLAGVLRNFVGASLFGLALVLIGLIPPAFRPFVRSKLISLWVIGSGIFLLMMGLLIAWAP